MISNPKSKIGLIHTIPKFSDLNTQESILHLMLQPEFTELVV